ncbi:FAD-dependent oxidoreductase, partial [Erwinia amylovora]
AKVMLESRVSKIRRNEGGTYTLTVRRKGRDETHEFDHVVVAVPNYWVSQIEFEGREERMAIQAHQARYDNPAHYLRVTIQFKKPFWTE